GTWTSETMLLPLGVERHGAAVVNGHVYVLGGVESTGTSAVQSVRVASVEPGGTVGAWSSTKELPKPGHEHVVVTDGVHVYALAGWSGLDVFAAPAADGSISKWTYTMMPPFRIGAAA